LLFFHHKNGENIRGEELPENLTNKQLRLAAKLIEERYGIHFESNRLCELEKLLNTIASYLNYESTEQLFLRLFSNDLDQLQEEAIITSLTINVSYFFREPENLDFFEKQLSNLVSTNSDRQISIWSAGCCCGQEPYTIAMLCKRHMKLNQLRLMASDENEQLIRVARSGIFSPWSFRKAPPQYIENCFTRLSNGMYKIHEEFLDSVEFFTFRLDKDLFPDHEAGLIDFDFIFFRNVLNQFSSGQIEQIIGKFWQCLKPGGYLILGEEEANIHSVKGFSRNNQIPAGVFRREKSKDFVSHKTGRFANFSTNLKKLLQKDGNEKSQEIKPTAETVSSSFLKTKPAEAAEIPEFDQAFLLELFSQKKYAEVLSILNEQNQNSLDHNALYLKARCEFQLNHLSEALESIDRAIRLFRSKADYHYFKGLIQFEQNKLDECQKSLQLVLYLDENHLPAHLSLISVLRKTGKLNEARKFINLAFLLINKLDENARIDFPQGQTVNQVKSILMDLLKKSA
jgi:chemotaxis protein methyltransferase CheR